MEDEPPLGEMTAIELSGRAANYAAMARIAASPDLRGAWERLAARYRRLAAERKIEENQNVEPAAPQ